MIAPARVAAYQVLTAVSSGRADLPDAIAQSRRSLPDERDRALAGEIATGVQRRQVGMAHERRGRVLRFGQRVPGGGVERRRAVDHAWQVEHVEAVVGARPGEHHAAAR